MMNSVASDGGPLGLSLNRQADTAGRMAIRWKPIWTAGFNPFGPRVRWRPELDGGRTGREPLSTQYRLSTQYPLAHAADDRHYAWPADGSPVSFEELSPRDG